MRTKLVRMGISRGIRLPKPMIEQAGLTDEVELKVRGNTIVIVAKKAPRSGWAGAAQKLHDEGGDRLLDPPTPTTSMGPSGNGRMPRMQVYLPDDLYELVKAHGLPASELLQKAVRAELRRLDLLAKTDLYVADLVAEVGPPTADQRARAGVVARRIARRPTRRAG